MQFGVFVPPILPELNELFRLTCRVADVPICFFSSVTTRLAIVEMIECRHGLWVGDPHSVHKKAQT